MGFITGFVFNMLKNLMATQDSIRTLYTAA
jgi:hypothetical protein